MIGAHSKLGLKLGVWEGPEQGLHGKKGTPKKKRKRCMGKSETPGMKKRGKKASKRNKVRKTEEQY